MLERKDIKVGDLLVAIIEMSTRIHPIVGRVYIVVDRMAMEQMVFILWM